MSEPVAGASPETVKGAGAAGRYFAGPALYDIIYSGHAADIPFHVELARHARGPALEIGCGTGRVLIPCVAAGAEVDGLDLDPEMLEEARRRLEQRGLRATLTLADMRDFALARRYALVTIPFNTFTHNLTQADQLATLRACRAHLEPGGRLVLVLFCPDPRRLTGHDGTPRLSMEHPHPAGDVRTVRVMDAATSDPIEQVLRIARTVEIRDAAGAVLERHALEFHTRWVWPAEMELLLLSAGFRRCAVEGRTGYRDGFQPKPRLEPGDLVVWTAWRD